MFKDEEKVVWIERGGAISHAGFLLLSRPFSPENITNCGDFVGGL